MPYTTPIVAYYNSGSSSWLTMSGVQSISLNRGRQRFQDPLSGTTAVIEIIPTASTTFSVGQFIEVKDANTSESLCYFQGRITDVQRSYAFPYNSVTGATPADRITISAAGGIGVAGARQVEGTTWSNVDAGTIVGALLYDQSLIAQVEYKNGVKAFSQFYQGPLLEAVNNLLNTAQLTMDDYKLLRVVVTTNNQLGFTIFPTGQQFNSIAFSDAGAVYKYTALEYQSSVQNTFNEIEVVSEGVDTAVTSGTAPFNTLRYPTYNDSVAATVNLSSYLYSLLSGQTTPVPFSISTDTNAAPTCTALAQIPEGALGNAVIGQPVSVTFRGTSATGTVIGVNSNFYPDYAQVQLYLSPSLGTPFTLDSASFGVLDQNRLGYP
jgi:hypothetical protein